MEFFYLKTAYWIIDGVVGGGPSSWTSGFGFKITTNNAGYYYIIFHADASNVALKHQEIGSDVLENPGR